MSFQVEFVIIFLTNSLTEPRLLLFPSPCQVENPAKGGGEGDKGGEVSLLIVGLFDHQSNNKILILHPDWKN
jgi:hypothetical protein